MKKVPCPNCGVGLDVASMMRAIPSEKRSAASRENGKKGGRPKKKQHTTS